MRNSLLTVLQINTFWEISIIIIIMFVGEKKLFIVDDAKENRTVYNSGS